MKQLNDALKKTSEDVINLLNGAYEDSLIQTLSEMNNWYLFDGDLELDELSAKNVAIIIMGDLTIQEHLVEPECHLIVLGRTTVNSLKMANEFNIHLIGGIIFNQVLITEHPGGTRVLKQLQGPFVYCDSESTEIRGVNDVKCYIDHVREEVHGDIHKLLHEKYIVEDDDYVDRYDEGCEIICLDTRKLLNHIQSGKNILIL